MNWLKIWKIANAQPYVLAISCDGVSEFRKNVHMNPVFAEFAFFDRNTAEREKANSRSAILFSDCSAPAGTAPDSDTPVNYAVVFCYRKAQYTGIYLSVLLLL